MTLSIGSKNDGIQPYFSLIFVGLRLMKRVYLLFFLLGSFLTSQSQDFSYKVNHDVSWKHLATVNFSEDFEDLQIENQAWVAPEPASNIAELKAKLDAERKRKYNKLHKREGREIMEKGTAIDPTVDTDFNGMPRGSGGVPNDNNMAISNAGMVISVINSTVTIMDDTGGVLMYRTLRSIVRGQLNNLDRTYDPKVIYDPLENRFILVFLQGTTSGDTRIITGFSHTEDPTGEWNFYAVDGNPFQGKTWSDYPIIGMNEEDFFITVNILRDGESWQEGFTQSVIWQINKESGYRGQTELTSSIFHDLMYKGRPIWSMCIVPIGDWATHRDNDDTPHMRFLSVRPDASLNDTLFMQSIYGTAAAKNQRYELTTRTTSIPYGVPPSAFQPQVGYRLQTNDTRVLDAFEQDGFIQYVQSSIVFQKGMPGIFHGVFRIDDDAPVTASYIYSDTFDYAYPSIAYLGDKTRNQASAITFSHSGELDFPGTSVVFYNAVHGMDDAYSTVVSVKEGEGLINTFLPDSIERWGDYTAIQKKYDEPGVAWLCGSHGKNTNTTGTWIGKVSADIKMEFRPTLNELILFPNPAEAELNLLLETSGEETLSFQIYDMQGKLVVDFGEEKVAAGVNTVRVNRDDMRIQSLRPGMYIFRVLNASEEELGAVRFHQN